MSLNTSKELCTTVLPKPGHGGTDFEIGLLHCNNDSRTVQEFHNIVPVYDIDFVIPTGNRKYSSPFLFSLMCLISYSSGCSIFPIEIYKLGNGS